MMAKREQTGDESDLMGPAKPPSLEAARAGDTQAFDRLVRPLLGGLLALGRRLVGPAHAEELVQEALTRCWRGLRGFREEASFRSWLVSILYRLAREPRRYAPCAPSPRQTSLEAEIPDTLPTGPLERATTREVLRRVEQAMERLPLRQRTALHLRAVQGWTYTEIAAALETTPGAVRTAVCEARNRLRERLGRLL